MKDVRKYLDALGVDANCDDGHYYLLNNYAQGYNADGNVASGQFVIPRSPLRNIGDALLERPIEWRYYGDSWDRSVADVAGTDPLDDYCDICNPFQYATSIMADDIRTTHLKDSKGPLRRHRERLAAGVLDRQTGGIVDGHPALSKLNLFEGFTKGIIDAIKRHPDLWRDTVIFETLDEGGGYYDSGYVQPLDFFGDGTRIPLVAVSPYTTGGHISHGYSDHVSILKFVERNWHLAPLTERSRLQTTSQIRARRAVTPGCRATDPRFDDLFDLFHFGARGEPDHAKDEG